MEIIRWIFASVILLSEFYLLAMLLFFPKSRVQYLVRDQSKIRDITQIPYSFARTQMVWWTLIVVGCLAISFAVTGGLTGLLDPGTLVLLGISTATTAGGTMIDNRDILRAALSKKPEDCTRHQDEGSEGFFADILSDSNGISIHRFQSFVFNLLYGLVFIQHFIDSSFTSFVHFDELTLGILGLSSAGYLTLKAQENR